MTVDRQEVRPAARVEGTPARLLEDRVAIITGGGKGIGRAASELFAKEGAKLVIAGRELEPLEALAEQLDGDTASARPVTVACDVTQEQDTEQLARRAIEEHGRIDILVNTAGGTGPIETPCHQYPVEDFREILDVNVVGTFLACKAVAPTMIENGYGRIVNTAGTSGLRGYRNRCGYSASKWAIRGFTRTLALELGPFGITVNDVCPNVTNGARMERIVREKAERLGRSVDEVYDTFAAETALGRFIDEIDVAEAILFLASERARNITGHDLVVDAGWDV